MQAKAQEGDEGDDDDDDDDDQEDSLSLTSSLMMWKSSSWGRLAMGPLMENDFEARSTPPWGATFLPLTRFAPRFGPGPG